MSAAAKDRKCLVYVVNAAYFFLSHRAPLARAAKEQGYDVVVITPPGEGEKEIRDAGFEWHPLRFDPGGMNPWQDAKTILDLMRLFRALRPDIVHNVTPKPVIYGTLAARLTGVPRVVNAISGLGYLFTGNRPAKRWLGMALYRLLMRHPDMWVILQNKEDMALFSKYGLAPPKSCRLIRGSGVDISAYLPAPQPPEIPVILQTSRMVADKGVREFIEAARLVKANRPEVRFVLVGPLYPGNPSAISSEELKAAQQEGAIEWLGPRNDIPNLLARATIFCLPSYREGLPKSLLEGAAAGLPLITTETSGCKEVVSDGENGILVPVADAPALAVAIEKLLADPALAARLGRVARARAVEEFSLDRVIAEQLSLYKDSALPI